MTNASRAPVDHEGLARDLRRGEDGADARGGDPLAELARIVGQDDPFRALLAAREGRDAAPGGWGGRAEPGFAETPYAPEAPARPTPADAFDQYLASVEQDEHAEAPPAEEAADEGEPVEEGRALRRAAPRRRLASVGAGLAVVAVAIAGALTYKGLRGGHGGGGVPVVQADTSPLKVAPKVADGVEIPDQNRQIYDRKAGARDGQIRIVDREEQPLDVAEAARAAQGPAQAGVGQGAGQAAAAGTTPGGDPFGAFGEPRRVRTVAVKPEAPPAPPPAAQAEASPIPTMTMPGDPAPAKPRVRQVATAAPALPSPAAQAASVAAAPAPAAPVQATPDAPTPRPAAARKAPQRVAAVSEVPASMPAPEEPREAARQPDPAPDAAAASEAPVGGFAVQLGVRNSASDARAALKQMQAKYSQLAGKPELIRQAEVNGKTLFRVRVGPLAKAEAASLCSALQGEGGQCFVAKN